MKNTIDVTTNVFKVYSTIKCFEIKSLWNQFNFIYGWLVFPLLMWCWKESVNVVADTLHRKDRMVKTNTREIKPLTIESINALPCCTIFWVVVQIGNTFWHNFLWSNCTYQSFRSNCSCIQRWFIVSRGQHSNIMLFKQGQTHSNIVPHFWFACKRERKRLAVSDIQKPTKNALIWRENEHKNRIRQQTMYDKQSTVFPFNLMEVRNNLELPFIVQSD